MKIIEIVMLTNKIEHLFNHYLSAFKAYNIDGVSACYHLPCTLSTPDKIVLLTTEEQCQQEFIDIFTQLKANDTANIVAKKASYQKITENLMLACIDWDFIDDNQNVFADFCAYYHLVEVNQTVKIVNVVSHELSNSLTLANQFELAQT